MKNIHLYVICTFAHLLICKSLSAQQNKKIDSLLVLVKKNKADTSKLFLLNNLSLEYKKSGAYDSVVFYTNQAIQLSNAIFNETTDQLIKTTVKGGEAAAYNNVGLVYSAQGNYQEALKNHFSALKIREKLKDKKGLADSYNNIGNVFADQGNFPEALKNYFASLKIREILGDAKSIASSYNNIGLVYFSQGNYDAALKNHEASLKIRESINHEAAIAYSYNNIGNVYYSKGDYQKALEMYFACLKIEEKIDDKYGISAAYNNIGLVYFNQAELEKTPLNQEVLLEQALKNHLASLKIKELTMDNAGIAASYTNIGDVLIKQKKFEVAEKYLLKAKDLAKKIGYKEYLRDAYKSLTALDSTKGDYKGAYKNHKLFILYRDSIDNEESRNKTIQSQMTYDFEKREAATQADQDKKDAVARADKKRQQLFMLFLTALAMAIGIIAIIIFRGLQQSKKAKKVIEIQRDEISAQKETVELQKLIVEEHQKEIVDSITYAKRIQYTLLANKQLLENNLPEHFVLFKPKDIVSGDFYWATKKSSSKFQLPDSNTQNLKSEICDRFYIAACDSTGHGVPGAFMSLLNISFLNEAVNEKNIAEPNEILNHVRKRLIENMDGGQDGMDCILLCIENSNFENESNSPLKRGAGGIKITYAAANNSPAIIKNGVLVSLQADKMPVGKGEKLESFTLRSFELEKGDNLYLYTDGYADQFGGPKGKKFKYKQLDELLVSISNLPGAEQSEILNQRFEDWRGNLEQVDDMLVIGIKI